MASQDSKVDKRQSRRLIAGIAAVFLAVWAASRLFDSGSAITPANLFSRGFESAAGPSTNERLDSAAQASPALAIAGVVRSATGRPIAKAKVTLFQNVKSITSVLANDQGEFAAESPPGQIMVTAEADGFGAASIYAVAPTLDLVVTLVPGNLVSGRVLLEGSEKPVGNVNVTAMSSRERIASPLQDSSAVTDENGRFTFSNLSAGAWILSVAEKNVWGESSDPIVVSIGEELHDLIIRVRAAASVSGRLVVRESGEPCARGRLQLIPDAVANPPPVLSAASDSNGRVHFNAVPTGSYRIGPICDEHMIVEGPSTLAVTTEPIADQQWKFSPGLGLTVNVTDESGAPIENASVALDLLNTDGLSRGQISMSNRRANTNARGAYRFGALKKSRYKISAQHASVNGKGMATAVVDLQSGSEPAPVTLTLPGRGMIRVRAHSAAGSATSRVLFFATDSEGARYEGRYAGNGNFSIGPLPRDVYRVFGYDNKNPKIPLNGGAPISVSGANTVDLDFEYEASTAAIEGRIIDGTGNAVGGVFVRAVSTSLDAIDERYAGLQTALHGAQESMTDSAGLFRIDGLRSDATFDLHIDHPSGMTDRRNALRPGTFVEVAFPLPAGVTGTVFDEAGRAIDRFDVVVDSEKNGQSTSRAIANANGRFLFTPVNPGKLSVTIYGADGSSSATRDLTAAPGQTTDAGRFVLKADEPES